MKSNKSLFVKELFYLIANMCIIYTTREIMNDFDKIVQDFVINFIHNERDYITTVTTKLPRKYIIYLLSEILF